MTLQDNKALYEVIGIILLKALALMPIRKVENSPTNLSNGGLTANAALDMTMYFSVEGGLVHGSTCFLKCRWKNPWNLHQQNLQSVM
jgi:hypothetical protein